MLKKSEDEKIGGGGRMTIPLITLDLNDENCVKIQLEGFDDQHYELVSGDLGFLGVDLGDLAEECSGLFICVKEKGKIISRLPIETLIVNKPRIGIGEAIDIILKGLYDNWRQLK